MRDLIRDLLDSARDDVNASRMLYVDNPEALLENAILKMDAAIELSKAYGRIKTMRDARRERYLLRLRRTPVYPWDGDPIASLGANEFERKSF